LGNDDFKTTKVATCLTKGETTYTAVFTAEWIPGDQKVKKEVVANRDIDLKNHEKPDEFTYSNNGDGTHDKKYACCGALFAPENHKYENGVCACEAVQSFTVNWVNGETTKTETVTYGVVPTAPFADTDLVKAPDKAYHYDFAGWSTKADGTGAAPEAATADVTYYAVFSGEDHDNTANCKVCAICGFNNVADHRATLPTCDDPAVCEICGTEVEPAMGHQYSYNADLSKWVPAGDGYNYVVVASCNRENGCDSTKEEDTLEGTEVYRKDADCLNDGKVKYQATVTVVVDGEATGVKVETEVTIYALGHDLTETPEKPSTCVEQGNNAYWTCERCKKVYKDEAATKVTSAEAEKRPYAEHTWDWDEGAVTTPATCVDKGVKTYPCEVDGCVATKTEEIAATGHNYVGGEVTYAWSDDNDFCTAARACINGDCSSTEEVRNTGYKSEVTQKAQCETDGVRTYTATFKEDWAETQTTTSPIPKTGHNYVGSTISFLWSDDKTTCEAKRPCQNSGCGHAETETVSGIVPVIVDATCVIEGSETYTATFTADWIPEADRVQVEVIDIPATGHSYSTNPDAVRYLWAEDGKTWCTATRPCTVCSEDTEGHFESVAAAIRAPSAV